MLASVRSRQMRTGQGRAGKGAGHSRAGQSMAARAAKAVLPCPPRIPADDVTILSQSSLQLRDADLLGLAVGRRRASSRMPATAVAAALPAAVLAAAF